MFHQGHRNSQQMLAVSEGVDWPDKWINILKWVEDCPDCKQSSKNLRSVLPKTEKSKLPDPPSSPSEELQIDFAGPFLENGPAQKHLFVAVDRFSRWPYANWCSATTTEWQ